jgi:hypothetical protein
MSSEKYIERLQYTNNSYFIRHKLAPVYYSDIDNHHVTSEISASRDQDQYYDLEVSTSSPIITVDIKNGCDQQQNAAVM